MPEVPADPDTGTEAQPAHVVYAPVSDNEDSGRFYCHVDKTLHEGRGARGTPQFTLNAESIPALQVTLMALIRPVTSVALPEVDLSHWKKALVVNTLNTEALQVFGVASPFQSFSLDMSAQTRQRTVVQGNDIAITGRAPSGALTIDDPGVDVVNYFERSLNVETGEISLIHGKTAGSIIEIVMPACSLASPTYADDQGVQMLSMNYRPEPVDGNDEVRIICR